jgi:DNA-directed RNA polymerase beta' subunit
MKALEDLTVQYDTTVRNSAGHMIQVRPGAEFKKVLVGF